MDTQNNNMSPYWLHRIALRGSPMVAARSR
jgi:hypothetical protein